MQILFWTLTFIVLLLGGIFGAENQSSIFCKEDQIKHIKVGGDKKYPKRKKKRNQEDNLMSHSVIAKLGPTQVQSSKSNLNS